MLLPGRIYIALGPWHFGDFRNVFLPNINEDQKNLTISALGLKLVLRHIMVNPAMINALRSQKGRCESEIATFRTKTLHFLRVIRLNWLTKIELRGTRRPWSSILLISYSVVSEKC